jgi:hypothetical protein
MPLRMFWNGSEHAPSTPRKQVPSTALARAACSDFVQKIASHFSRRHV